MKRLNGAWIAYGIVFILFEIVVGRYMAVFDRFDQMRIINNWHAFKLDYLFRALTFAGELLIPILLLILFL